MSGTAYEQCFHEAEKYLSLIELGQLKWLEFANTLQRSLSVSLQEPFSKK